MLRSETAEKGALLHLRNRQLEEDGVELYSQPLARAMRAASTRLVAPSLLMASDR